MNLREILDLAAATVELYTGNGAQTQPDWPRTSAGGVDLDAVAKTIRTGPTLHWVNIERAMERLCVGLSCESTAKCDWYEGIMYDGAEELIVALREAGFGY